MPSGKGQSSDQFAKTSAFGGVAESFCVFPACINKRCIWIALFSQMQTVSDIEYVVAKMQGESTQTFQTERHDHQQICIICNVQPSWPSRSSVLLTFCLMVWSRTLIMEAAPIPSAIHNVTSKGLNPARGECNGPSTMRDIYFPYTSATCLQRLAENDTCNTQQDCLLHIDNSGTKFPKPCGTLCLSQLARNAEVK